MYARYIREMAELYGYTPEQVGQLTVYQINVLYAKDGVSAQKVGAGVIEKDAGEYKNMTAEQRRRLLTGR